LVSTADTAEISAIADCCHKNPAITTAGLITATRVLKLFEQAIIVAVAKCSEAKGHYRRRAIPTDHDNTTTPWFLPRQEYFHRWPF
jgi:hypothetical protein